MIHATVWMNFKNVVLNKISQHERSHARWFNLNEIARKSKSVERVRIRVISWSWEKEGGLTKNRHKEILEDYGNILKLDFVDDCTYV